MSGKADTAPEGGIGHSLKAMLRARRSICGVGLSLGCLRSAEMIARTRFDFVMIDTQHGHFDKTGATNAIRLTARGQGPCPLARVATNDSGPINDLLDAGAMGIVVPMLETSADARSAVQHVYYPPLGRRSKGSLASVVYGPDYPAKANDSIALIVMIETPEAVNRAEEILSVEGVDGCLIGSSDLVFAMQTTRESAAFHAAVDHVVNAAKAAGVAVGINVASAAEAQRWRARGFSFFLASHDLALLGERINEFDSSFADLRAGV